MVKNFIKDKAFMKTKRIAVIGMSSPTAYLYGFQSHVPESSWDWNTILESPQGLSVLYDEIYFLHKALCPYSMLHLPFVTFIEELDQATVNRISHILSLDEYEGPLSHFVDMDTPSDFSYYDSHIKMIFGESPRDLPIDNHTRGFSLNEVDIHADSQNPYLILKDLLILEELEKGYPHVEFELITNKFTMTRLSYHPHELSERSVAQDLLINGSSHVPNIPVLQNERGPDLRYIEKLREANSLGDFRDKLLRKVNDKKAEHVDVEKMAYDIREAFNTYEEKTLYSSPSKLRKTWTISSPILKGLSYLIPGGESIRTVISGSDQAIQGKEKLEEVKYNWASFITAINREKRLLDEEER